MPSLDRHDDVFVLTLGDGENRFNKDSLDALEACLDEVEAAPAPRALVTTADGKFWSNGLDLEWLANQGEEWSRSCRVCTSCWHACSNWEFPASPPCRATRSRAARCWR